MTGGRDYVGKVWDVTGSKTPLAVFPHDWWIWDARFSPDGQYVATAGLDGKVKIWHLSGKLVSVLQADQDAVFAVGFHPKNNQQIATAGTEGIIRLWNWEDQPEKPLVELTAHQDWISRLSWNIDGTQLATASADGTSKVWDLTSRKEISSFAHPESVMFYSVSFSPDGKLLALGRSDGLIQLWRPKRDQLNDLLDEGCNYLKGYLIKNPQQLIKLKSCQHPSLLPQASRNLVEEAKALAQKGRLSRDDAIRLFKIAQKWDASNVPFDVRKEVQRLVNIAEAEKLLEKGIALAHKENYKGALEKYDHALRLNPQSTSALIRRGVAYYHLGKLEKSLADFEQASQLEEENAQIIATRGEVYQAMYRFEQAIQDFNQAIKLNPELLWTIYQRGNTYRMMEKYEKAIEDFNKVIEINPNNAEAIANRGQSYFRLRRYQEAIADFNRAIALNAEYVWAIDTRGIIYNQQGRYEEAIQDFNHALAITPESSWTLYNRALAYHLLGNLPKSQEDLAQALQIAQKAYRSHPQTPSDWRNSLHLGIYHLATNQFDIAERLYREVLSQNIPSYILREGIRDLEDYLILFPDNSQAKSLLTLLHNKVD